MPIKIELAIREGWKATANNRFGEAFEVRFINAADGKIMFRYAPKCEDQQFWEKTFRKLNEYDRKLKDLKAFVQAIDGNGVKLQGEGCKDASL